MPFHESLLCSPGLFIECLRGVAQRGAQFYFMLAVLRTRLSCSNMSLFYSGSEKGVFWKTGSFQKSSVSRDSREFRDSREIREPPDCGL